MIPYGLTERERQVLVAALRHSGRTDEEIHSKLVRCGSSQEEADETIAWMRSRTSSEQFSLLDSRDSGMKRYRSVVGRFFLAVQEAGGGMDEFGEALALATEVCGAAPNQVHNIKVALTQGIVTGQSEKNGSGQFWVFIVDSVTLEGENVLAEWRDGVVDLLEPKALRDENDQPRIFIGHGGRSRDWETLMLRLKGHGLHVVEFGSASNLGSGTTDRVANMLEETNLGLLVMSAEDEVAPRIDTTKPEVRSRQNVIHELGLWQGRYGFRRGIMLVDQDVAVPSNLSGVTYVPYEAGNISTAFLHIEDYLDDEFPGWRGHA